MVYCVSFQQNLCLCVWKCVFCGFFSFINPCDAEFVQHTRNTGPLLNCGCAPTYFCLCVSALCARMSALLWF